MWLPYGNRPIDTCPPNAPAIKVQHVCIGYPGSEVLHDLALDVPHGTHVALLGPNGAGKSTLMKTIAGLLPPLSGTVHIHGLPIARCRARVAYLPQRSEIDWRFPVNVFDLVLTGRYVHLGWLRQPDPADRDMTAAALDRLGIANLAERHVSRLSGGQQQRVLLARALVQGADVLLLDEPFTGIDQATSQAMRSILAELRMAGITAVIATHDLAHISEDYDQVVRLGEHMTRASEASVVDSRRLVVRS